MKNAAFPLLLAMFFTVQAYAQNVGVGTNNPQTKLEVNGAISSTPATGTPSAGSLLIPANVSVFRILDDGTNISITVSSSTPKEGQYLTIYNSDALNSADFNGATVAAVNGVAQFQYISSNWRMISNSSGTVPFTAGSGLSWGGNTLNSVWTKTGNDVSNNNAGRIGVGTSSPKSTLDVNGSLGTKTSAVSGTTTLDETQSTIIATPGTYTITLPTIVSSIQRVYHLVYDGASGGATITIKGNGSENIRSGGLSLNTLALNGGTLTLQNNGTEWIASTMAPSSGSGSYIQNNTTGSNFATGQSANFDITGSSETGGNATFGGNVSIGVTSTANTLDVQGGVASISTNGTNINLQAQAGGTGGTNGGNVNVNSGTGGNANGAVNINVGNNGNVNVATSTSTGTVNIGGSAAQTINIANDNTNTKTISIGGTSAASAVSIKAGATGGVTVSTLAGGGASYVKANSAGVLSPQTGVPGSDITSVISVSNLPDATTTVKGIIKLAGDLNGVSTTADVPVISNNAISTAKILDANVTTTKIADANVTTVKIADNAVTSAKILDGEIVNADIANSTINLGTKVTSLLPTANGGMGANMTAGAIGAIPYASSTTAYGTIAAVATGNALISAGVGTMPTWGKIGLATHVSGTLPVANGGTGAGALTPGSVVFAGSGGVYTGDNANLFWDNTNDRLGIGTASPDVMLDLQQPAFVTGTNLFRVGTSADGQEFVVNSDGDVTMDGELIVGGSNVYDNSGNLQLSGEDNVYVNMDYNDNDADTRNIIFGKNGTTAAVELMRIKENGLVGIGTAAPGALLNIVAADDNPWAFSIRNNTFSTSENGAMRMYQDNDGVFYVTYNNLAAMGFATNGYVGIGTYTPGYPAHIKGTSGDGVPTLLVESTAAPTSWNSPFQVMMPSMGTNGKNMIAFGKSYTSGRMGYMYYQHAGNGNSANAIRFGFYGSDDVLNISYDRSVIAYNTNASGNSIVGAANNQAWFTIGSGTGGSFSGLQYGLLAKNTSTTTTLQRAAIYSEAGDGTVCLVNARSATNVQYKIWGTGTVSTLVEDGKGGTATLHAAESPEIYFTDYGESQLVNGKAHIELDPLFAANVTVNSKHPLRVYVQLEGDCRGVYVTNKTGHGFDVIELSGGTSNVSFQWNVVCNRADDHKYNSPYADVRFESGPVIEKLVAGKRESDHK